ncbi:hypothetical protein [Sedimentibacter sp. MB31-C6]|uniref:hypothetical protein n=1 Tax=Sedimentibacter sp. MB31-C6 TaxID=3109366 RepID=UPI002DDD0971|nr:hypothetical protein [Sedimentibacter sp. MB36-C1]WSI04950.1 hypothetical protein U8307_03935 [Sedimentibacter sp. MB36-C1]
MLNLWEKKLKAAEKLNKFTEEIISLSPKIEEDKISSMILDRQKLIEEIEVISSMIEDYLSSNEKFVETEEMKLLKMKVQELIKDTIEKDKVIRTIINKKIKTVKDNLNQPKNSSKFVNIKA